MFHQVKHNYQDQQYLQYLWRDNNNQPLLENAMFMYLLKQTFYAVHIRHSALDNQKNFIQCCPYKITKILDGLSRLV